jgi:ATP-dependent DNA ligase
VYRLTLSLRALPLTERRRRLERLVEWSDMPCLRLMEAFADGERLLKVADQHRLEGVVSKRKASVYRSGPSRDWRKIKTAGWREANRKRWRLFEAATGDRTLRPSIAPLGNDFLGT